jgi:8-oxo-dGTP diphosphatase
MKNAVVVFLLRRAGRQILLAQKHKGSEVAGLKWNGYGGKIEAGETPGFAAVREIMEETDGAVRITERDLHYGGVIEFYNCDEVSDFRVHLFYCFDVYVSTPPSTEVMINPTWFDLDNIDQVDMMPADKLFLPLVLKQRKTIQGKVIFEKGFKSVREFSYTEIFSDEIETLLGEVQI